MRRLYLIICSLLIIASLSNTVGAQSLMQTAKKAEQRAKELKQQENSRYHSILESHDLSKYEQFIKDYPNSQNTKEIKKRAAEIRLWNNAKNENSILAYENYLNNSMYLWYDNEANEAIRIIKKVSEKQEWEKVVAVNTIEAYQQYLNDNPTTGYKIEAENAIKDLRENEVWERIKNSNNIYELENFIKAYPNSSKIKIITSRLHELNGVRCYNNANLNGAYAEFSKVDKFKISPENLIIYNEVMEHHDFQKLGNYASEGDLLSFIRMYPNGKYHTEVSNKLAITIARNLGYYSTESDYAKALSYAKDDSTRKSVQGYIARNKNLKAEKKKAIRAAERNQNGGFLNLGFDFMDIGINGDQDILYYNIGLIFRMGNFNDRLQMAIGVKPGIVYFSDRSYYDFDYKDSYSEYKEDYTKFHMPLLAQLKLNLFNITDISRFFIYGKYQYNTLRIKNIESDMAWGVGCGFAWKHFDWSFYYRKDFGRAKSLMIKKHDYFGMSLIYYWQL